MTTLKPMIKHSTHIFFLFFSTPLDAPPNSLLDSNMSPKVKTTEGKGVGAFLGLQHFGGRGVYWSSGIGL